MRAEASIEKDSSVDGSLVIQNNFTMVLKKTIFLSLIIGQALSVASFGKPTEDLTTKLFKILWANQNKRVKNRCEIGKSSQIKVGTFLLEYNQWALKRANKGRSEFKCEKKSNGSQDSLCEMRFGEFDQSGSEPGWDLILRFTYDDKIGIHWKTITCEAVP